MIAEFTKVLTYSCTLIMIYLQRGDYGQSLEGWGCTDKNSLQLPSTLTEQRRLAFILGFPTAPVDREEQGLPFSVCRCEDGLREGTGG